MSNLWNISTDPLPPVQPKEVGYQAVSIALYKFLPSLQVLSDAYLSGWQFCSYSRLVTQSQVAGNNKVSIYILACM